MIKNTPDESRDRIDIPVLQPVDRTYVLWEGKRYHFFSGYDYHRLSSHPDVVKALQTASSRYGISTGGSRITTGTHPLHLRLEEALAQFFDTESAVVLPSGYLSNLALLQVVSPHYDPFFIDEYAHPSLMDAILLTRKNPILYHHCHGKHLHSLIRKHHSSKAIPLIITEGTNNTGSDLVPLNEYLHITEKRDGQLMVDDAHAAGVLGKTGKGSWEEAGVPRDRILQTGTLSKAFGIYAGFITGSEELTQKIKEESNIFQGSSALPLPLCAAAICSISILSEKPHLITELQNNSRSIKTKLRPLGLDIPLSPTPVIALTISSIKKVRILKNVLLDHEIYPSFIQYPTAPVGGYFRFALSSAHTDNQLECLYQAIETFLHDYSNPN